MLTPDQFAIAEALLDAGILQNGDWQGDLTASVNAGLARWFAEIGAAKLDYVHVEFEYSNDLAAMGISLENWFGTRESCEENGAIGGFAFYNRGVVEATVGLMIKRIEAVHLGAGYSVLAILSQAVWATVGGATPAWAEYQVSSWAEEFGDEATIEDEGLLTLSKFHETCPQAACTSRIDIRAVAAARRALERDFLTYHDPSNLAALQALEAAVRLLWRVRTLLRHERANDIADIKEYVDIALAIRWRADDEIIHVADDHYEAFQNCGCTSHVWLAAFRPDKPEEIRKAADQLAEVVPILVLIEKLLSVLDEPE